MAIVGSAEVIIRAITKSLKSDIKRGLDDAASDIEASGDKQGQAYAAHFSDSVADELENELGDKISDAIRHAYSQGRGDRDGRNAASKFLKGLASGLGAAGGVTLSLAGLSALIVGITGLIGGLVGALGALVSGLVAVAAASAPAVAALGVLAAAGLGALLQGIGVGIGIFAQLRGELEDLSPAAAAVRGEFDNLKGAFKELFSQAGDDSVFGPLRDLLETIGPNGEAFDSIANAISSTGDAIGSIIGRLNELFENPLFLSDFSRVTADNATLIESLGTGFVSLGEALGSVLAAASPLINRFAEWFSGWAEHIADVAQLGQETGSLTDFFNRAGDVAAQLGDIFKNVFGIIRDVAQAAAPLGAVFLRNFQLAAAGLNQFLDTARGREGLENFFEPGGQLHRNISATWELVKELGVSLRDLSQSSGIESLAEGLTRTLPGITQLLDAAIIATGDFATALGNAFQSGAGEQGIRDLRQGIIDLGDAFSDLGPSIGPLLSILGDLASNLADVLGPAFQELGEILPGLRGPLDDITQAIGTVLVTAIQALAPLLPRLAELIAQLAQAFAGPLGTAIQIAADILGVILDVAEPLIGVVAALAPVITALATAFIAMRVVSSVSDALGGFGSKLQGIGGVVGAVGTGIRGIGAAASFAGPAIGLLVTGFALYQQAVDASRQFTQDLAQAMLDGGAAAEQARASIQGVADLLAGKTDGSLTQNVQSTIFGIQLFGHSLGELLPTEQDVAEETQRILEAMSPLDQATQAVTNATNDLELAVGKYGENSIEARLAQFQLTGAQAEAERQQEMLDEATKSYADQLRDATSAIYDNLNAELARSNADIAAQQSILSVADAQDRLTEARAEFGDGSREAQRAELDYQAAINTAIANAQRAAEETGRLAEETSGLAGTTAGANANVAAQIAYLEGLAATAEGPVRDAILGMIEDLQGLGAIRAEPYVDMNDAEFRAKVIADTQNLLNLGGLKAKPSADLNTEAFDKGIGGSNTALSNFDSRTGTPDADLDSSRYNRLIAIANAVLTAFGGRVGKPTADLNPDRYNSQMAAVNNALTALNNRVAAPTAILKDEATKAIQGIQGALAGLRDRAVTVTTTYRTVGSPAVAQAASGGLINSDQWTTVGEEGRELVFLSRGQYVATYQKAQRILAAAAIQARGAVSEATAGSAALLATGTPTSQSGTSTSVPITVYPSADMNETELARKTGREFAWRLGKVT